MSAAEAVPIGGYLTVAYAIMQFVFSPIIGNLSDRYGRRPILIASLAALSIDYLIMGFAPTLFWLFVGRLIAGIAGATFGTANAVVADIIPPAERSKYFGLNGAAWGVGFIVGPVIGGLLGAFGPRVPFFFAAGLVALNLLVALFVLRETLAPENRRPFTLAARQPVRRDPRAAADAGRDRAAGRAVPVPGRTRHAAVDLVLGHDR
jgi:MFS transporter, DHA1 family, tetracycline resistance protein